MYLNVIIKNIEWVNKAAFVFKAVPTTMQQ